MVENFVKTWLLFFGLTIISEGFFYVFIFFGSKVKFNRLLMTVFVVNLLTHLPLWIIWKILNPRNYYQSLTIAEVIVVFVEWRLLIYMFKKFRVLRIKAYHIFLFSLIANLISTIAGLYF